MCIKCIKKKQILQWTAGKTPIQSICNLEFSFCCSSLYGNVSISAEESLGFLAHHKYLPHWKGWQFWSLTGIPGIAARTYISYILERHYNNSGQQWLKKRKGPDHVKLIPKRTIYRRYRVRGDLWPRMCLPYFEKSQNWSLDTKSYSHRKHMMHIVPSLICHLLLSFASKGPIEYSWLYAR